MRMLKLLIADGTEEFRLALAEQVAGRYVIKTCQQGKTALELLVSFRPDVMVLDLMLPGLDGISLLQQAAEKGIHPMVLATTRFINDYVLDSVTKLGVGYLMVKPCDVKATATRLEDLREHMNGPAIARPEPKTVVSNLLLSLGVPAKLRGFAYLREAILESVRRPGQLMTKEIYPTVGAICDASRDQVERSIRSAIAAAWNHRDEKVWRQYFAAGPNGSMKRPSNGVFIVSIAERMANNGNSSEGNS